MNYRIAKKKLKNDTLFSIWIKSLRQWISQASHLYQIDDLQYYGIYLYYITFDREIAQKLGQKIVKPKYVTKFIKNLV